MSIICDFNRSLGSRNFIPFKNKTVSVASCLRVFKTTRLIIGLKNASN